MEETTKVIIIRMMYLIGFALDGIVGIMMIMSTFTQPLFIVPYTDNSAQYQFAMGWGASLMLGWTILLLWGSFKPIERRDIFLITAMPVVSGLIMTDLLVDPILLFEVWLTQVFVCFPVVFIGYFLALNVKSNRL